MSTVKIYDRPGALTLWWRAWGWLMFALLVLIGGGIFGLRLLGWP